MIPSEATWDLRSSTPGIWSWAILPEIGIVEAIFSDFDTCHDFINCSLMFSFCITVMIDKWIEKATASKSSKPSNPETSIFGNGACTAPCGRKQLQFRSVFVFVSFIREDRYYNCLQIDPNCTLCRFVAVAARFSSLCPQPQRASQSFPFFSRISLWPPWRRHSHIVI